MSVRRIHEQPRVTKPYTRGAVAGDPGAPGAPDRRAAAARGDVRLTDGRRADLRLDRRPRRRRVEHRGGRADQARPGRRLIRRLQRAVRAGRHAPLRAGQVVPGRAAAALGVRALLARRRPAAVARPGAGRRRERRPAAPPMAHAERFILRPGRAAGRRPELRACRPTRTRLLPRAKERMLPANVDPVDNKLDDPMERARLARVFDARPGRGRRLRPADPALAGRDGGALAQRALDDRAAASCS